jgi:hypothetical protein
MTEAVNIAEQYESRRIKRLPKTACSACLPQTIDQWRIGKRKFALPTDFFIDGATLGRRRDEIEAYLRRLWGGWHKSRMKTHMR